jgi:hypothetical protein
MVIPGATVTIKGGNPRLVALEQCGRSRALFEGASLVFPDPDPVQVTRQVVALGQAVQGLVGKVILRDLAFEVDAVGAVLHHGLQSPKARQPRSTPQCRSVHFEGRNPNGDHVKVASPPHLRKYG